MDEPAIPVAIAWFWHRRTHQLCQRMNWRHLVLETPRTGILRYATLSWRTILTLARDRPRFLVVQNPSMVLVLLCIALRPMLRFRLVVDAHNEAVSPYLFSSFFIRWAARFCLRAADLTIVTNGALARTVAEAKGTPAILPDPLPQPPASEGEPPPPAGFTVVIVSTFARDEPLAEMLAAAKSLQEDGFLFKVTGNPRKLPEELRAQSPANVSFTGFLPEAEYWDLLRGSDAILDLTLMPNCLVCGAYEAVAVRRPLVLSDGAAAREWFGEAASYVGNDAGAIAAGLRDVRQRHQELERRIPAEAERIEARWIALSEDLAATLHALRR